ncbi:MAG: sodium-independent anion transporter [Tumebacillaceae bacterium]
MLTLTKVLPDHDCPQIAIFKVEGPLFFGSAQAFERSIFKTIHHRPRVLLLKMNKSPFLDTSGEAVLAELVKHVHGYGGIVLLSELKPLTRNMLIKTGLHEKIGEQHVFARTGPAIDHAILCLGCTQHAFRECDHLSTATTAV